MDTHTKKIIRQDLHDRCMKAYQETGTVRSAEWKKAKAELNSFEAKYGRSYNPD